MVQCVCRLPVFCWRGAPRTARAERRSPQTVRQRSLSRHSPALAACTTAQATIAWQCTVSAFDPDHDFLVFDASPFTVTMLSDSHAVLEKTFALQDTLEAWLRVSDLQLSDSLGWQLVVLPRPNRPPVILNAALIRADTASDVADIGVQYQREIVVSDADNSDYEPANDDTITLVASPPLTVDGMLLQWTPAQACTLHMWVVAFDGEEYSDTVKWTMRVRDRSRSHPRIEVMIQNPQGQIHPLLLNSNMVGRLHRKSDTDTLFLQQKVHGPVVENFDMVFDSAVDTGSAVIVDYWFEKDTLGGTTDTLYAPPSSQVVTWIQYPEPSGRFDWGPIVFDATGGHGVQLLMTALQLRLYDLSQFSQTPLAP